MGCSCRWHNKGATSRIGSDWLAVIRKVLWRQVVRTLEHNQTQFKLDTLMDWQPVKEITHHRGNAVVFAPAEYQSSCGVKDYYYYYYYYYYKCHGLECCQSHSYGGTLQKSRFKSVAQLNADVC